MVRKPSFKGLGDKITRSLVKFVLLPLMRALSYTLIVLGTFAVKAGGVFLRVIRLPIKLFVGIAQNLHRKLGAFFPFNVREWLKKEFLYAGLARSPEEILGATLIYAILSPVIVSLILSVLGMGRESIILGIGIAFLLVWVVFSMIIILMVERRTTSIEDILPDVLSMVAQNMIAGMTPYNSLWVAARPEFGPLADELQQVARDTLAGASLETALTNMTERVKSDKLGRSVRLMVQGMKSGGDLPTVLQEIANDIRNEQNLIKRMRAETTAQAMFIVFAILVGAPLLFASSLQFITIFSQIYSKVEAGGLTKYTQSGMMTLHPLTIEPEFFYWYAIYVLIISSGFGALLVGLIRSGKLSSGMTMIPILIALSVLVFLGLNYGLSNFFGNIIVM